ncbi:MAG: hypothetical protein ACFFCF_05900 [Promethearchaeota archaeon]
MLLAFITLLNSNIEQALGFWQNLLEVQIALITMLGILLGFSGVIVFYQMRRYDQFLFLALNQQRASQVVLDLGARELLEGMFEGETFHLPEK